MSRLPSETYLGRLERLSHGGESLTCLKGLAVPMMGQATPETVTGADGLTVSLNIFLTHCHHVGIISSCFNK